MSLIRDATAGRMKGTQGVTKASERTEARGDERNIPKMGRWEVKRSILVLMEKGSVSAGVVMRGGQFEGVHQEAARCHCLMLR